MAVTFPDSPVLNQSYQAENGLTYIWDGEKWSSQSAYNITEDNYIKKDGSNTVVYADNLGMGVGTTSPATTLHAAGSITAGPDGQTEISSANYLGTQVTSSFHGYSQTNNGSSLALTNARSNTSGSPNLILNKASGDLTTPTAIGTSQTIGALVFNGYDGTNFVNAASIRSATEGTIGTDSVPGNLTFWTSPAASATPDERMRIDSNGNIGIGSDNPTGLLEVKGPDASSVNFIANGNVTDAGLKLNWYGAARNDEGEEFAYIRGYFKNNSGGPGNIQKGELAFGTGGIEHLRISQGGNIGIGTDAPAGNLHVKSDGTTRIFLEGNDGRSEIRANNGNLSVFANSNADVNGNNNTIFYRNGANESMRIDTNGYLGIGTNNPEEKLHIAGSNSAIGSNWSNANNLIRIEDTDNSQAGGQVIGGVIFEGNDSDAPGIQAGIIAQAGSGTGGGDLAFHTAASGTTLDGTESSRMVITESGKVGIGNSDPEGILTLGDFDGPTTLIRMRCSNAQVGGIDFGDPSDVDSGRIRYHHNGDYFGFFTNGLQRARIDSDGIKFGENTAADDALDDYEEGVFTPQFTSSASPVPVYTAGAASGYYTKVGRKVNFTLTLTLSSLSNSPGGNLQISGFPFTSVIGNNARAAGAVGYAVGFNNAEGSPVGWLFAQSGTTMTLYRRGSDQPYINDVQGLVASALTGSCSIRMSGTYLAA